MCIDIVRKCLVDDVDAGIGQGETQGIIGSRFKPLSRNNVTHSEHVENR